MALQLLIYLDHASGDAPRPSGGWRRAAVSSTSVRQSGFAEPRVRAGRRRGRWAGRGGRGCWGVGRRRSCSRQGLDGGELNTMAIKGAREMYEGARSSSGQCHGHIITAVCTSTSGAGPCRSVHSEGGSTLTFLEPKGGQGDHSGDGEERLCVGHDPRDAHVGEQQNQDDQRKVRDRGRLCHGSIVFHTDATQWVGRCRWTWRRTTSICSPERAQVLRPQGAWARCMYCCWRAACSWCRSRTAGAGQVRSGTLNVSGIVGLGGSGDRAVGDGAGRARLSKLRRRLETRSDASVGRDRVNGHARASLPHITNISLQRVSWRGESAMMHAMQDDRLVVRVRRCTVASLEPSWGRYALCRQSGLGK